ncbi:MAG: response regulator transcription factor [Candidatus Gracilibacteria bacterium]|nr:response regulator transcription factor [Candidatus Gracilibacteria bacterium]
MKVLIIEDHPSIRNNIIKLLKKENCTAQGAMNGKEGLQKLLISSYDVIILDVNMPIMNGREFIQTIRNKNIDTPVLALTSNSMLDDKIDMFELGVDDYLTKPFNFGELFVRLKSLTKRKGVIKSNIEKIGNIEINYSSNKIFLDKKEVEFQNKQYKIIKYLLDNKGYPKTKIEIMEYVWGEQEENLNFNTTILESHIYIIRKKLGKNFIKTIKGVGYIIENNLNN